MPTYEYEREDGTRFEHFQKITEDALTVCPTTGQKVERLISAGPGGFILKGSGWYKTDYGSSGSGGSSSSSSKNGSASSSSASSTAASSDAAPASTSTTESSAGSCGCGKPDGGCSSS